MSKRDQQSWPWWKKAAELLESRRISAAELARRLDHSERSVRRWLGGENAPTDPQLLQNLAEELGVSVAWLTNGQSPEEPESSAEVLKRAEEALSPQARRVVQALSDPSKLQFLADCLDALEKLMGVSWVYLDDPETEWPPDYTKKEQLEFLLGLLTGEQVRELVEELRAAAKQG